MTTQRTQPRTPAPTPNYPDAATFELPPSSSNYWQRRQGRKEKLWRHVEKAKRTCDYELAWIIDGLQRHLDHELKLVQGTMPATTAAVSKTRTAPEPISSSSSTTMEEKDGGDKGSLLALEQVLEEDEDHGQRGARHAASPFEPFTLPAASSSSTGLSAFDASLPPDVDPATEDNARTHTATNSVDSASSLAATAATAASI
ncbi:hypothetical protein SYNPS1DRAFT_29128, partial [Syncephalis pseudoplumigaleata]